MFGKQKTQLNIAYPHTRGTFARKWSTVALVCAYVITSVIGGFVYQITPAEAAIPKLINFQGKLTAVSNGSNVANGSYTFEFKLYDDPSAGSLLWTETWDGAPAECPQLAVAQGVFNAKLGSCNPLTSVDFTGGALYLSVNFNPGAGFDGEMTPRKQLVSSAYAFVANSVSGDGVVNNAIQSATALSTGRTSANPALQVDTNTASSATGLKVTAAAAAGGIALAAISSGTDENLTLDAKGAGTLSLGASSTGNILLGGGSGSTGCTVTNGTGAFACTAGGSFTTMALTGAVTGATGYNGLVITANTGVVTTGTWNGTAVVDTYVADTLTVDSSSSVHWNALNNYPAACSAGSAISQLADTTNTCTAFNTDTTITLQDAYDATSGNTITTTTARNIAIVLADVATPTSLTIENQDTAATSAQRIFSSIASGTATNGLLIEQTGAGTMTNGLQIAETAGTITDGILITGTLGNILNSGSIDITGAGAITGATGISSSGTIAFSGLSTNGAVYTSGGTGTLNSEVNLDVTRGGTGVGTFTSNGVLYGNTTGDLLVTAQGAANTVLVANAGAPSFSAAITVGTSVTSPTINATTALQLGGTNINTAGTLSNVAYLNQANAFTAAQGITIQSATALNVARTGTNYAFQVDTNTASSATGVKITAAAAAGGVAIAAISSGTDENITFDAKGAGTISLGASSTGDILLGGGSASTGCTVTNATGAFACTAGITGSNLSGTNTGDVTLAAIGAVPNANGATLTGQVLNLQPASASFGGVVTTGTQTFAGEKTFSNTGATNVTITNTAATTTSGVLAINATSTTGDFVPGIYSNRIVTGTGSLNAAYGFQNLVSSTAVVTGGGVGQTLYGTYNGVNKTGADTATGTYTSYGSYNIATNTGRTNAGTVNTYGGYFSAGGDTAGTSTAYGLQVQASGADNNYAIVTNGGNVGIGDLSPASLFTVGSGDLFQINSSGQIGVQAAPSSDSLMYMAGTTGNDNSRIINITQANNAAEDTYAIQLTNTVSPGSLVDTSINIANIYGTLAPTATATGSSASSTIIVQGNYQSVSTGSITMGATNNGENNLYVYGNSSSVVFNPTINDTGGTDATNARAYGTYSTVSGAPALTLVNTANIDSYGAYFANSTNSAGSTDLTYNSYGVSGTATGNLTTTGQTSHYAGYFSAGGTADTNYGVYIDSATATTNYGIYVNSGTNYMADDVYVGALTETLSNTGFAMDGDDVFINGKLGVEASIYTDTSLIVGASTTYANGSISQSSGETLSIGTTSAALTLQTTTSGDINISPAGNVLLAGGSGSTGCTVTGTTGALACTSTIASGVAGGTIGGLLVSGNTSGTVSILPQAAAGTYNFNLPTTAGNSGEVLTSAGGAGSAMTWTAPGALAVRWSSLVAPTGNLSLAHGASTTAFTFNSVTSGSAFGLSSTSLTSGNLLQATGSGATMTTGGELIDLVLGANTVGAGLTVTSTGTYTGVGAADGLINITANGLTTGYAFQIPHTTSVISGAGSLMRLSSSSVDTGTAGTLLSLASTGSTAGTIAMITNNTASFTGISQSISNTGITTGTGLRVTGGSGMTTGGELIDLVLGSNTVGAGITITSIGTYTGTGAADGLINVVANALSSGLGSNYSFTGLTTGSGQRITGSGATMQTGGELVDLVLGANTVGAGLTITGTGAYTGTGAADGFLNIVGNSLTTGHGSKMSYTAITSGTGLLITGGSALTTNGELIDLNMSTSAGGQGINITNTGTYTGTGLIVMTANSATTGTIFNQSATALTTGRAQSITLGTALTTGGLLSTTGASYLHTGSETGSLVSLAYTDASSNAAGAAVTNGILLSPTINTTASAGSKTINGISIAPTHTACGTTAGTCAYNGITQTTAAVTQTTTNALTITGNNIATAGALVQNTAAGSITWVGQNIQMPNITQTTGTVTSIGLRITGGTVTSGTAYALTTSSTAGNVGIGTTAPGSLLQLASFTTAASNYIYMATEGGDIGNYTTGIKLRAHDDNYGFTIAHQNVGGSDGLLNIIRHENSSGGTSALAINRLNGNVGINTTGPDRKLDILDASNPQLRLTYTDGSVYTDLQTTASGYLYMNPSGARVGIGTNAPTNMLDVAGTAGFGFENLELNGGFESGAFTAAYTDVADGGSGTLTVTSGGGWEGTYFVRNSAQVGSHSFRLRPTFVIPTDKVSLSYYGRRSGVANSWGSSPANGLVTPITLYLYDETSATAVCNTGANSPGTTWTRYNVSCSITAGHTFSVQVMMDGWGGQYNADIDAVQVEAGLAVMEYGAPLKLSTNGGGYIMGNVGVGTTAPSHNLVVGTDLGAFGVSGTSKVVVYGNTADNFYFVQGQGASNNLQMNWIYNATAGNAYAQIVTNSYNNAIRIDASNVVLQTGSTGNVGIGEATPTTAKLVINQTDAANLPGIYINTEESTTTQSVFSIESDTATGSGADTVKFKITADGSVYSDANVYGTPADVAEMYNISGPVTAGDVVEIVAMTGRLDGEKFGVKRHEPSSNAPVLGVISTAPGTTLGYEWKRPDILAQQKPVALVGRVPIKVTNENGAIMPGDFLVASATQAGYAMKATKAGPVIGQALDKLTGATGSITAFIKPTNYNGVAIEDQIAGGLDFDYGDEDQTAQTSEQMLEYLIAQLDELDYDNLSQINTDLVIAGAEVVSPNVTTQTLRTDFLSSATADGSLTVASATIMNGGLIVDEIGSVGGLLSIMSDVEFFGTPYFTVDTAGFAVIKAGVQSVDVTFSREYLAQPIVNASVSFEQDVDQTVLDEEAREVLKADAIAAAQSFLAEGVSYVITNKSRFGFTIVLSKPAPTDVKMSWTALAVRNASTFMSLDTPEGFVAGAGDPGDGDTPPGDGSGDGGGDGGAGDGSGGETPPPSDPPPSDPPPGDGSGDGGIGG